MAIHKFSGLTSQEAIRLANLHNGEVPDAAEAPLSPHAEAVRMTIGQLADVADLAVQYPNGRDEGFRLRFTTGSPSPEVHVIYQEALRAQQQPEGER